MHVSKEFKDGFLTAAGLILAGTGIHKLLQKYVKVEIKLLKKEA